MKTNTISFEPWFHMDHQSNFHLEHLTDSFSNHSLPSQLWLSMASSAPLADFSAADLCLTKLNRLAPRLWMYPRSSCAKALALHTNAIHGRAILPTEDSSLHLVLNTGHIFIQPRPAYPLSHEFGRSICCASRVVRRGRESRNPHLVCCALTIT